MAGEEVENLGLGVGVVEPDGANVGGVGRVVCDLGRVETVPAVEERVSPMFVCKSLGWHGGGGRGTTDYSFVPSLEGARGSGRAGADMAVSGGRWVGE